MLAAHGREDLGRPLNVVYLTHVARLSGAELALIKLQAALGDRVSAHTILFEDGPLAERVADIGGTVDIVPMHSSARDLRRDASSVRAMTVAAATTSAHAIRLARRLRYLRPDLVHIYSLKAGASGGLAARAARLPLLWHVHDRIAADYLSRHAMHAVRSAASVLPHALVANSECTRATLPSRARVHVVPYGISPVAAPRSPTATVARVGIVGRIALWKGQDVFLRAFAEAFPAGDVEAVVVGSPLFGEDEYERQLHALCARLGISERVDFRGFRSDTTHEYSRLDIVVHASVLPEPFGQVVVEAMAAGVPVVAARAGGPGEIITDEIDGLLHEPGNASELAGALRRLAADHDLRSRLAVGGLRRAGDFAPEKVAQSMLSAYRDTLRLAIGEQRRGAASAISWS